MAHLALKVHKVFKDQLVPQVPLALKDRRVQPEPLARRDWPVLMVQPEQQVRRGHRDRKA